LNYHRWGGIMLEIKSCMRSMFTSCIISFCPRVCNCVAHALAAQGCKCSLGSVLYWDRVPSGIKDLVTSDIT
jgi:hypothetical protein